MTRIKGRISSAPSKYHAVKTRGYHSGHEAERARELRLMEQAGKIQELREQVRFELIPAIYELMTMDAGATVVPVYDPPLNKADPLVWCEKVAEPPLPPPVRAVRHPEVRSLQGQRARRKGRCIERSCEYVADFVYYAPDERGLFTNLVVEDAKGVRTKEYVIKRKLMLWVYGIRVKEV